MAVVLSPVVPSVWCDLLKTGTCIAQRISRLLLCTVLLVAGFTVRVGRAQRNDGLQGARRFIEYCAGCHGADAKGGDKGPSLAPQGNNRSDSELLRIIRDGTTGGMPAFAQIGEANITAVVQFLRTLESDKYSKSGSAEVALTGNANAGRALYFGKAQCSQCHLMQGKGGFIAVNLTNYGRNRSADEILKAITTPDSPLAASSQVVAVTTSTGQNLTGVLRNEDNFNLELQSEDGHYHLLNRSDVTDVRYTGHSLMPRDYAARLSPTELNDLVAFLIVSSKTPRQANVEMR